MAKLHSENRKVGWASSLPSAAKPTTDIASRSRWRARRWAGGMPALHWPPSGSGYQWARKRPIGSSDRARKKRQRAAAVQKAVAPANRPRPFVAPMMIRPPRRALVFWICMLLAFEPGARAVDLSRATVVCPPDLTGPLGKAVTMLIEEVEKRTDIRWDHRSSWPASPAPVIAVGAASELSLFAGKYAEELAGDRKAAGPEGYRIHVKRIPGAPAVFVIGNDARGVLFGIGHLLRSL